MPAEMRPSEVFALRLRETRKTRPLSQTQLAKKTTEAGRPMTKAALLGIEKGTRGLGFDEAFALTQALPASFANLLSPPDGAMIAPTENLLMDGGSLRQWLLTGLPVPVAPATIKTADDALLAQDWIQKRLAVLAFALGDASRVSDHAGVTAAAKGIVEEVKSYLTLIEGGTNG